MTAAYQSFAHASAVSGNNIVITKPSGTVDGDLLVANIQSTGAVTQPGGWNIHAVSTSTNVFAWKIASGEGASYSWGQAAVQAGVGAIARITGAHPTTPIDAATAGSATGAITLPTLTSAGANRLLFQFVVKRSAVALTWSQSGGSTTERWDATTGAGSGQDRTAGGDETVGAGATGTRTWTPSAGAIAGLGFMAAIAPVPANTGTFTGSYDFTGTGFTGQTGPGEGSFTGAYDFTGSGFTGESPGVASGQFAGTYDFSSAGFTGEGGDPDFLVDVYATEGGRRRWGGRK